MRENEFVQKSNKNKKQLQSFCSTFSKVKNFSCGKNAKKIKKLKCFFYEW